MHWLPVVTHETSIRQSQWVGGTINYTRTFLLFEILTRRQFQYTAIINHVTDRLLNYISMLHNKKLF